MKEANILDDLVKNLKGKEVDYASLRNAMESRKLTREIKGMGLNRNLAIVSPC